MRFSSAQLNSVVFDKAMVKSSEYAYELLLGFFPDSSQNTLKLFVREKICLCDIVEVFWPSEFSVESSELSSFSVKFCC